MKVGDLVRLSSENRWRYPARNWCKEHQLMIVIRASEECIAFEGEPTTWRPQRYFEVVSRNENQ
jgi:hypothetical protein